MENEQIHSGDQVPESDCHRIVIVDYDLIPHDRKCYVCGEYYPATNDFFYSNKAQGKGLDSRCKECDSSRRRVK